MITRDRLDQLLSYDPGTDTWTWRVNRGRMAKAGSRAGYLNAQGYWTIQIDAKYYLAHRLVWFWHHGEWPTGILDHINQKRTDNRLANLRICTHSQNHANVGLSKANTSGYKGVSYHKVTGKWMASIKRGGDDRHLGLFETPELAHEAYKAASLAMDGEMSVYHQSR
jgi:hypothetical protein